MSKHLSNSERLRILEEYFNGSSSKYIIQKKYDLSSGSIFTGSVRGYSHLEHRLLLPIYLRQEGHLPKAGCRELYLLCKQYFKEHFTLGRDSFYALLRSNGLMLHKRRYRPRTTNSNHRFQRYEDLINTEPKLVPKRVGELVVADITYISYQESFAYLCPSSPMHTAGVLLSIVSMIHWK